MLVAYIVVLVMHGHTIIKFNIEESHLDLSFPQHKVETSVLRVILRHYQVAWLDYPSTKSGRRSLECSYVSYLKNNMNYIVLKCNIHDQDATEI